MCANMDPWTLLSAPKAPQYNEVSVLDAAAEFRSQKVDLFLCPAAGLLLPAFSLGRPGGSGWQLGAAAVSAPAQASWPECDFWGMWWRRLVQ